MQTLIGKIQRFLSPILENKIITFLYVIYFIIETSFGVLFIFFVRDVILIFENGGQDQLMGVIQSYLIYFILLSVLMMLMYDRWTLSYNRYRSSIESKYLPKYIQLDSNILDSIGTGKIIAIISGGVNTWGGLIDRSLIQVTQIVVSVGVSIYFLLQIQSGLVLLLFVLLIIGQVLGYIVNVRLVGIRKNRIELANIWSKHMVKIIMSKMEILQSDKIKDEVEILKENHEGQIYYNKKMAIFLVPFFMIGNIIVMILLCVSFYYFSELYFIGRIGLSDIAALSGALMLLQKEFINSLDFVKNFGKEFALVQNIWDFFDETPEMKGYDSGNTFEYKNGKIELKSLKYGYTEHQNIFEDFSLALGGGKVTALVGPSGGGKTTLVKLIAGYIHANGGDVIIDNQKISETALKSYYENIGYLTQEPSVFDGTIRENLSYALKEEVDDKKMIEVLKLAECDFVLEFEKGIDTEIGEKGIRLSGGQRQRLAIAKIFLKDPKIIILDEPTSALDSFSEQKIANAMEKLFDGRTVMVIAHRLQTVKHADEIIYIEGGKVIERGNHSELVKQNGLYKDMLDLQSGF